MARRELAYLLVGDHLGQVKKVLPESGEITLIPECATPSSSNPIVSIEPISNGNKYLFANREGQLYIYDAILDKTTKCENTVGPLIKALPITKKKTIFLYDKQIILEGQGNLVEHKKGEIKNGQVHDGKLAIVGVNIPLKIYDIERKTKFYDADPPEKNWLGIKPDVFVADLNFVGRTRVATCSKSDSIIRVYDTQSKPKPIISVDINQTAFNEHADSARFTSVTSTGDDCHTIVVGSNVGQILAIDLRFNVKQIPKKRMQPRNYKILGGFKGPRGATIKDVKLVSGKTEDEGQKVISCCLDRYLRIHNFTKSNRTLDKHVYMTTKPFCCTPVFYDKPLG